MLNNSAAYGYSVVSYNCISPNYWFGHEFGHNMGSAHAPEDGGSGYYPYSYGYKHPSNLFRTVMAYDCPERLPARAALLRPRRELRRRADRHRRAARQRPLPSTKTASTVANFRQAVGSGTDQSRPLATRPSLKTR